MADKPKLAVFWASSCGGCEVSLLNLNEKFLAIDTHFDLFFCPCLMDTKTSEIEALPDESLAITLFNGSIRTSENEEMARLLRRKSKLLIAFGSCSYGGGIPALSNLSSKADHFNTIYLDNPSLDNPGQTIPLTSTAVAEGNLELPEFYETVKQLSQVVPVDYSIPGCPPEPHQIWKVVEAVVQGAQLPAPGAILGTGTTTVCEECTKRKDDKTINKLHRTYEIVPDPERCLFEQGLPCMGIATRGGCGALCPQVNMPCTGCYGAPSGVADQGAKRMSAVGSGLSIDAHKGLSDEQMAKQIDATIDSFPDLAGTFYKFSMASSLLGEKTK